MLPGPFRVALASVVPPGLGTPGARYPSVSRWATFERAYGTQVPDPHRAARAQA